MFAHGVRAGANIAWSPAYTWIVGAALELVHPSRTHELLVVMVVNVLIVAVALVAFAWWLRELFALIRQRGVQFRRSPSRSCGCSPTAVLAWAVLSQVTAVVVTPDMLLAAVGFAATAALMRIARLGGSPAEWLALGVLLGVGYLVKSGFVVPAVVACAACAVLSTGGGSAGSGRWCSRSVRACASRRRSSGCCRAKEGRLELGDYGTLNYAWDVDGVTRYLNWTGGNGDFGRPLHPTLVARRSADIRVPSPAAGASRSGTTRSTGSRG